jgi:hypothetical protein
VKFGDLIEGVTVEERVDERTGLSTKVVIDTATSRSVRVSRSRKPMANGAFRTATKPGTSRRSACT